MVWKKYIKSKLENDVSRRTFIKGTAAVATGAALAGCSKNDDNNNNPLIVSPSGPMANSPDLREVRKVYSTCPVECLTHSLNCQLVGNEVVRVEPTTLPNDPCYTTACARGMSRMQFLTENRAPTPMKRIKRGTLTSPLGVVLKNNKIDEWVSISWAQALSEIGTKLKSLRDAEDKGIMLWTGSGNMGPIVNGLYGNFFGHVNPNRAAKFGNSCCQGVDDGMKVTYGARSVDTRDTVRDARCIINWGNSPADTSNTYWKYFIEAKQRGAKIITIDPRYSGSAEKSDQWIQIKPGTDNLLAIGLLRWIFQNDASGTGAGNYVDESFMKHRTNAPYLIDFSDLVDPLTDTFYPKAYNTMFKLKYKQDASKKELIFNTTTALEEAAEKNTGKTGMPTQDPNLYYIDWATKTATALQLMRALYSGDLLTAATQSVGQLSALHDPTYIDSNIIAVTGASALAIANCAQAYVESGQKSMIIENMGGAQRTENGGHLCAIHCILSLITGNVGGAGNGVDDTSGYSSLNGYQSNDAIPKLGQGMRLANPPSGSTHNIPFGLLGRRAKAANNNTPEDIFLPNAKYPAGTKDPAIKFWWLATSNLLTQFPNTNDLKDALSSSEMVVVAKPTWNTDADYADYFLPVTTPFEYEDIGAGNRNKYISLMEAGVLPYGQSRSDQQILRDLAKIVFPDKPDVVANFDHEDSWYPNEIIMNPANNFTVNGIPDYNTLKKKKTIRPLSIPVPWIPHHNHEFLSAQAINGRAKIFITDWNIETTTPVYAVVPYPFIKISPNPARDLFKGPFPRYVPALNSHLAPLADFPTPMEYVNLRKKYPLCAVQYKVLRTVHASFTGLSWIREAFGDVATVLIHPEDALARDIMSGELVTVRSSIGSVERIAVVTPFIMRGVTGLENGWWDKYGKVSASTVGAELPDPMGCGHTHNNTLVEVTKGGII